MLYLAVRLSEVLLAISSSIRDHLVCVGTEEHLDTSHWQFALQNMFI